MKITGIEETTVIKKIKSKKRVRGLLIILNAIVIIYFIIMIIVKISSLL